MKCRRCHLLGHIEQFHKEVKTQQKGGAHTTHTTVQQQGDQLFVATCFSSTTQCDGWLVDSGCTNHMTSDKKLFKDLDMSFESRVK